MANYAFVGSSIFVIQTVSLLMRPSSSDIESFFIPSVEDIVRVVNNQPYALEGSKITVSVLHSVFIECQTSIDIIDRLFGWWLCVQRFCL